MRRRHLWVLMIAVAATVVLALPAGASIVSVSGSVVQIAPPPSVQFGALQSDDHMFAFDEQQNVTLAAALPVDISQPGQYGPDCGCDPLTPGTIPAGTTVSSLFVHADPIGTKSPATVLDATIVTSTPIVGIEVCGRAKPSVCGGNDGLDASDAVLGAPGTLYPTGDFGRGMNFDTQNDYLVWMVNDNTVEIQTSTEKHVDQVRIITAGSPPPPPPPATIIVKKLTVPSGAPTTFTFAGDPSGTIVDGQTISEQVPAGTYTSTEQVPVGWQLTSISCNDPSSSGNVSTAAATFHVSSGQTVMCTFTDTSTENIGRQGLTPGYWKQPQHFAAWAIYTQSDTFDAVFNVSVFPPSLTLLQALAQGGGGVNALGRQAVAALLNATNQKIDYPLYSWQVIQLVHDAISSGNAKTISSLESQLEGDNSLSG